MMRRQAGFTLTELLIGLALGSVMMAAVLGFYVNQQRYVVIREKVAAMQQSGRIGMAMLARDIRMAGYDPIKTAIPGLVTDLPAYGMPGLPIDYAVNTDIIAFTIDINEDGVIASVDANGDNLIDAEEQEEFAYRLNNDSLERFQPPEGVNPAAWHPAADHIEALNFVLLDAAGNVTTDPIAVRSVQITLLARTENSDAKYVDTNVPYQNRQGIDICPSCTGSHYRHLLMSTVVTPRNLGL
ncbi:MAG: prepilin-type N-terminal cleavage/methylation domain-containing protein [bacterium]|nr:prepilin-type N-terminal cleavage/methylation domain-containing protein [bacterium]